MDPLKKTAKQVYHAWEKALSTNNLEQESGIFSGHKELRRLIEKVAQRKPTIRGYFLKNYFTDGKTMMFEYPRQTPDGEQMDFLEVMEINNGLIQYHRVYWGWRGFKVLKEDKYHHE